MSGSGSGGRQAAVEQDVVEAFAPTHVSTKAVRALEIVSTDDLALGYLDARMPDGSVRQVDVPRDLARRGTPVPGDRLILYRDGYVSWCPRAVFERDYRDIASMPVVGTAMGFGEALRSLKRGERVCRTGWNGKGMHLELQVPDAGSKMTLPYIFMFTVTGDRVPWLASQTDMLADDWMLVPRAAAEPPRVPRLPAPEDAFEPSAA
ncbi:DUF2829 domain-containing protein [Methylobacterium sp. JK268]